MFYLLQERQDDYRWKWNTSRDIRWENQVPGTGGGMMGI